MPTLTETTTDANITTTEIPETIPAAVTISKVADPHNIGTFYRFELDQKAARHVFPFGTIAGLERFTGLHRAESFWMIPNAGTSVSEVDVETQFLLVELDDRYALYVPLISGRFRCALQGNSENILEVIAESGDPTIVTNDITALFVAEGDDLYKLLLDSAKSVRDFMKIGRLRIEKPLPPFVDQFGWCTWDSFYKEVSAEKVGIGLQSFKDGGIKTPLLILDDGWQCVKMNDLGAEVMTSFEPNEKFQGDLRPTVRLAKEDYGVKTFIVWHAMNGYWGGTDPESFPQYDVRTYMRNFSPGIIHHHPTFNDWFGGSTGLVSAYDIYHFYQQWHRKLLAQGVDGVKVDVQGIIEGVSQGQYGRVEMMRTYHEALEGSAQTHFLGNMINCMSCANDILYSTLNTNITRSSTDFWPDIPSSHGVHLYTNAQVSTWFGEFIHPDWDMFQSGHPQGGFHAAGRAVSGSPIYVSDKPDAHDFDVLRKLVLPSGEILRCLQPGKPTLDCIFYDPTKDDVLLKIFNLNPGAGVIGAFNARYPGENENLSPISGQIKPSDVAGLNDELFVVRSSQTGEIRLLSYDDSWSISLDPLAYDVFTVVPVDGGIAPIGLIDLFNSSGAILKKGWFNEKTYAFDAKGGGRFGVYSASKPANVLIDRSPVAFDYESGSKLVVFHVQNERFTAQVRF